MFLRMYLTDVLCQDRAGESSGQHPVRCHRGGRGGLPGHRRHHEGQYPPSNTITYQHLILNTSCQNFIHLISCVVSSGKMLRCGL